MARREPHPNLPQIGEGTECGTVYSTILRAPGPLGETFLPYFHEPWPNASGDLRLGRAKIGSLCNNLRKPASSCVRGA